MYMVEFGKKNYFKFIRNFNFRMLNSGPQTGWLCSGTVHLAKAYLTKRTKLNCNEIIFTSCLASLQPNLIMKFPVSRKNAKDVFAWMLHTFCCAGFPVTGWNVTDDKENGIRGVYSRPQSKFGVAVVVRGKGKRKRQRKFWFNFSISLTMFILWIKTDK